MPYCTLTLLMVLAATGAIACYHTRAAAAQLRQLGNKAAIICCSRSKSTVVMPDSPALPYQTRPTALSSSLCSMKTLCVATPRCRISCNDLDSWALIKPLSRHTA